MSVKRKRVTNTVYIVKEIDLIHEVSKCRAIQIGNLCIFKALNLFKAFNEQTNVALLPPRFV